MVDFSFRADGGFSCIGPTRNYRSCNVKVNWPVSSFMLLFSLLLQELQYFPPASYIWHLLSVLRKITNELPWTNSVIKNKWANRWVKGHHSHHLMHDSYSELINISKHWVQECDHWYIQFASPLVSWQMGFYTTVYWTTFVQSFYCTTVQRMYLHLLLNRVISFINILCKHSVIPG